jgi:hypothetical protein
LSGICRLRCINRALCRCIWCDWRKYWGMRQVFSGFLCRVGGWLINFFITSVQKFYFNPSVWDICSKAYVLSLHMCIRNYCSKTQS